MSDNILYNNRIRRKNKWYKKTYYKDDSYTLKEKLYIFWYNMNETGYTTEGESKWAVRMVDIDLIVFNEYEYQFKKDYSEYLRLP